MILFFDTETTGKPIRNVPEFYEGQPHIVELSAALVEEDGKEAAMFSTVIKPDGWTISEEAAAVHSISQKRAEEIGIPIVTALSMFRWLARSARLFVAHSVEFDRDRVNAELHWASVRDKFEIDSRKCFCTKLGMMDQCRLPFAERKSWSKQEFKWPSLQEAFKHCFGREFDGAHGALADVRACKEVFFWMKQKALTP